MTLNGLACRTSGAETTLGRYRRNEGELVRLLEPASVPVLAAERIDGAAQQESVPAAQRVHFTGWTANLDAEGLFAISICELDSSNQKFTKADDISAGSEGT